MASAPYQTWLPASMSTPDRKPSLYLGLAGFRFPNRTHITAVIPSQTMIAVTSEAVTSPSITISTTNATIAGIRPAVIAATAREDVVMDLPPA